MSAALNTQRRAKACRSIRCPADAPRFLLCSQTGTAISTVYHQFIAFKCLFPRSHELPSRPFISSSSPVPTSITFSTILSLNCNQSSASSTMAPSVPAPPVMEEFYSGIPSNLLDRAHAAKERLMSQKTAPDTVVRDEELPVLPPYTTRDKFNSAMAALSRILGASNVEINDKPLKDGWYIEHPNTHDAYHLLPATDSVSSAACYPGSTEEVSAVVKWANQYEIPIFPISIGRNLGYGGAAPRVRGSVVVDLGRRMNKVLKLDGENYSCLVEPGVTYYKLYDEVKKSGLPMWIDPPDLGGGSVIGNTVDRGVGYTLYGDHFANHCGMEVVLPTGEVIRTGMGGLPGPDNTDSPTWQSFQYGFGPYYDGIFTQSNFGIVTKLGMWLMPETEHQTFMVTFPRDDDFGDIVEVIRPLMVKKILGNVPQLRNVIQELAVTGKPRSAFWKGTGRMPREVIREHASKMPCGDCAWVFYGTVYGTKEQIADTLKICKVEFGKIQGAKFIFPEDVPPDHYLHSRVSVCSGVPEIRELDWLNWKPNAGHLFFAPISPTKKEDARTIYEIVLKIHQKYGFDMFPTYCINTREMHYIANLVYDRNDEDEKQRAMACMREMIDECAKVGYGEYRTHILLADQVAQTYSWNNQALMKFHEVLKDTLDPKGILAPGRSGIWPAKYRNQGWELLADDDRQTSSPADVKKITEKLSDSKL
ncbi:glycolate oxidase [Myxozyma melibiosi]|uniref:Glycolate oxidase n=1 Tax=Myxozyma melibiosi TaxID=54550 RepID=A0ABR1FAT3_9ASCO